jgi:hypothetical protein
MSKPKEDETRKKVSEQKDNFDERDFRVWKNKSILESDNIIDSVVNSQSDIKKYTENLDEERYYHRKKKSLNNIEKFKIKKNDNLFVSDTVKKIMGDVGKMVVHIRNQEDTLSKYNIDALLGTTQQLKNSEVIAEPNTILRLKEKEYKLSLEGKIKRPPNYKFLSDSYRKRLNKIFMEYNPMIHLGNIHMLRKTNPRIDEQFKTQIKEIDEELKPTKGFKFFNEFERKRKKIHSHNKNINIDELNLNNTLNYLNATYTFPTAPTMTNTSGISSLKHTNNIRDSLFKTKYKKIEIKRKFPNFESREKELNLMKNACEQIDTSISPKNFNRYFRNFRIIKNTDLEQQKHTFFGNMENAQKILTEIKENMYIKKMENEIRNKQKHTSVDVERVLDRISNSKDSLLFDINEQEKRQNRLFNK